jgi:hypothetical protein
MLFPQVLSLENINLKILKMFANSGFDFGAKLSQSLNQANTNSIKKKVYKTYFFRINFVSLKET